MCSFVYKQTSVARAGSTVNFQVVGPLYESLIDTLDKNAALGWTLAISGLTCIISVLCAVVSFSIFYAKKLKVEHWTTLCSLDNCNTVSIGLTALQLP